MEDILVDYPLLYGHHSIQLVCLAWRKNCWTPASLNLLSFFAEKTVGFSGIRTWIIRVEGEHTDHLTTTVEQNLKQIEEKLILSKVVQIQPIYLWMKCTYWKPFSAGNGIQSMKWIMDVEWGMCEHFYNRTNEIGPRLLLLLMVVRLLLMVEKLLLLERNFLNGVMIKRHLHVPAKSLDYTNTYNSHPLCFFFYTDTKKYVQIQFISPYPNPTTSVT